MKNPVLFAACLTVAASLHADPCGMVPPVMLTANAPELIRVGDQLTYVFFKDGIEDITLRPEFKGNLTNFGMLIPFPAVPEIRKVPDDVFPHIENAVYPPEIVIDLDAFKKKRLVLASRMQQKDYELNWHGAVTVIKEEAVGMYQVVVLEATNPLALQGWMQAHGYVYPAGMDTVCQDYIDSKWCFVAVKANVGNQAAVEPKPGMRFADPTLPDDAAFEGAVQAMGFRFRIDKPIVPMRLSAFNKGKLHNIVYYFGDESVRIRELPSQFVTGMRSGNRLYKNMTEPLPVRIIGGTLKQAENMGLLNRPQNNRAPHPKNGHAMDLFASDLLAVRLGRLSHPFEEREKELLKVGERLGLRGQEVDELIGKVINEERTATTAAVMKDFRGMTLTVIEGDFPRDVIAGKNLTFKPFASDLLPKQKRAALETKTRFSRRTGVVLGLLAILGVAVMTRRRRPVSLLVAAALCLGAMEALAADKRSVAQLFDAMSDAKTSEAAAATLIARGNAVVPKLIGEAVEGTDYSRRGWAIVCLADIGDKRAVKPLQAIIDDADSAALMKMWAGAAIMGIRGMEGMRNLLQQQARDPSKRESVAAVVLGMRGRAVRPLVTLMLQGENNDDRRNATAWLGTLDQRMKGGIVRKTLLQELSYSAEKAKKGVPWQGGALWLPQTQWPKDEALSLSYSLTCWMLWAEINGKTDIANQVKNNVRDLSWRNGLGLRQFNTGWEWTQALLTLAGKNGSAVSDKTDKQMLILIVQLLGEE